MSEGTRTLTPTGLSAELVYRFNPFDLTKVISQQVYPLIDVGTMTLDRNPTISTPRSRMRSFADKVLS